MRQFDARVTSVIKRGLGDSIRLCLNCPGIERIEPGQFIMIEPLNITSVQPRPFSAYMDQGGIIVEIKVVGENTNIYAQLEAGDVVTVSGPHGKPFKFKEGMKKYILVGGGMGAAPLVGFAREIERIHGDCVALIGIRRTGENVIDVCKGERNIVISQSEKISGRVGLVTDLLEEKLEIYNGSPTIIACGPKLMLKAVAEMAKRFDVPCYVIMEEIMACGVGSCCGCVVSVDGSYKKACTDGPTFNAAKIDWDKIVIDSSAPLTSSHPNILLEVFANKIGLRKAFPQPDKPMGVVLYGQDNRTLSLDYPTMTASGCIAIDAATNDIDLSCVGAIVVKGIKKSPISGNKMPRVAETTSGMLNAIGLQGVGVDEFLENELPAWLEFGKPIIVNIAGDTPEEFAELAARLSNTPIAGIEANISCPNRKENMVYGTSPELTFEVVNRVRQSTDKFLVVKLSPNVTDIAAIALAAEKAGADAISLINTIKGMDVDVWTRYTKLGFNTGGLSGPATLPVALRMVDEVYSAVNIPVIGMGGISSGKDAAKFIMVGASAIAVGTGMFKNHKIFNEIISDLFGVMQCHDAKHITDLIGQVIKR